MNRLMILSTTLLKISLINHLF